MGLTSPGLPASSRSLRAKDKAFSLIVPEFFEPFLENPRFAHYHIYSVNYNLQTVKRREKIFFCKKLWLFPRPACTPMSAIFVTIDRETPLLFPEDLRK
jgi:hypothetical protein